MAPPPFGWRWRQSPQRRGSCHLRGGAPAAYWLTEVSFDVAAVRAAYPITRELAYFNTGTYGIMAEPALARHLERVARFERRGMAGRDGLREDIDRARTRISARIGAAPAEIALTGNATDGIACASAGLDLAPGDEVLISDQEHPAMVNPWSYTARRRGLVLRRFRVAPDPEETLAAVRTALSPRTRLVAVSHVTSPLGVRLPVREICALAHGCGALGLVDAAQSFGVMPVDVRAIGCDLLTGNGHKWLGAPKGTGFFYARRDVMERLQPAHVGDGSLRETGGGDVALWPDGRRFEYGTRAFAITAGLGPAMDWMDELGWERVSTRIERLTGHLKRSLAATPGVELLTPAAWERSSGLVTFRVPGRDETELQRRLEDRALFPRTLGPGSERIRVSCALFNTEDELDRLVACVGAA